jgi:hypothetical protein
MTGMACLLFVRPIVRYRERIAQSGGHDANGDDLAADAMGAGICSLTDHPMWPIVTNAGSKAGRGAG